MVRGRCKPHLSKDREGFILTEEGNKIEAKILIVDDEEDVCKSIGEYLEQFGHCIDRAHSVEAALELMDFTDYEIVIADKNMPDKDGVIEEGGISLLRYAKKRSPATEILMMTGYATIETAIEAMRLGAFDYLVKPFSIADLKTKIDRILEYKSFIDPENTIQIYKGLHEEILNLLERKDIPTDDERHNVLKSLDAKIDHFFRAQKNWERIIIIQKEALAKIAGYAEKLREDTPQKDPNYDLVEKICEESSKRI